MSKKYDKQAGEKLLRYLKERDKGVCEWKRMKNFEDRFLVSSDGRFYSLFTLTQSKITKYPNGYFALPIMFQHPKRHCWMAYVHRLVAENFIPNPLNKPTVNHKDGDKSNNRVENLEWATFSEQDIHACRVLGIKRNTSEIQKLNISRRLLTDEEVAYIRKYGLKRNQIKKMFGKDLGFKADIKILQYKSYKDV